MEDRVDCLSERLEPIFANNFVYKYRNLVYFNLSCTFLILIKVNPNTFYSSYSPGVS